MPHHLITMTAYHSENTVRPAEHQHTRSGMPLAEGCAGESQFIATCSCTAWTSNRSFTKNYTVAVGGHHRATQLQAVSGGPSKRSAELPDRPQLGADN